MVELLEAVNRPKTFGFQADMAHTLLFTMGYNASEHRMVPKDFAGTTEARSTWRSKRSRTRSDHGRSISMSHKTTRR